MFVLSVRWMAVEIGCPHDLQSTPFHHAVSPQLNRLQDATQAPDPVFAEGEYDQGALLSWLLLGMH